MRFVVPAVLLGLAACGSPTLQTPSALSVVNLSPTDGAVDVPVDAEQSACFSAAVAASDASASNVWVVDASGAKPSDLKAALASDPHCISLSHAALKPAAGYPLHVLAGLFGFVGLVLLVVVVVFFLGFVVLFCFCFFFLVCFCCFVVFCWRYRENKG